MLDSGVKEDLLKAEVETKVGQVILTDSVSKQIRLFWQSLVYFQYSY